jgi:hypothetical protein
LPLGFGHGFLDPLSRGICLFGQGMKDFGLAFAIGEPGFDAAADDQHGYDQRDETRHIFAEEAAAAELWWETGRARRQINELPFRIRMRRQDYILGHAGDPCTGPRAASDRNTISSGNSSPARRIIGW